MIGIFGGTFNPVHNGHIQLANQVLDSLNLDAVHFLPCANPVHRGAPEVSSSDRLNMIKLAIADEDRFVANTLELDRGGASFMVDTLGALREAYPNESIGLMLGADAFNDILSWKQPESILQLAHIIVCQRPGVDLNHAIFSDHWVQLVARVKQEKSGHVILVPIKQSDCSSTKIRQQLSASELQTELQSKKDISCLPTAVFDYIVNHHLYET